MNIPLAIPEINGSDIEAVQAVLQDDKGRLALGPHLRAFEDELAAAVGCKYAVLADIEPRTLCIDPELVEAAITPRTKAILAVDVFGRYPPCFGSSSAYNDYAICVTCIA